MALDNRDQETGKWAWNPFKKGNTIVVGGSTNSSFSNFTVYGGVGSNYNMPSISYNTDHGLGFGNAGNPGFNEFYYPSVNDNLPEQSASNAVNAGISNYKQSQENFSQFLKQRTSFIVGQLTYRGWVDEAANGGDRLTGMNADGTVYSFSIDFAFGGGFGFEIGYVKDKIGNGKPFISGNANIGYGIGAGLNIRNIYSKPGYTFNASDYFGYSSGFSGGIIYGSLDYGGDKSQWNYSGFLDYGNTYNEIGTGYNFLSSPKVGVWWYNAKTGPLF